MGPLGYPSKHICPVLHCTLELRKAACSSWFSFPTGKIHQKLRAKWIAILRNSRSNQDWEPPAQQFICSRHFKPEDIQCFPSRQLLKRTAVPSEHLYSNHHDVPDPECFVPGDAMYTANLNGSLSFVPLKVKVTIEAETVEGVKVLSTFLLTSEELITDSMELEFSRQNIAFQVQGPAATPCFSRSDSPFRKRNSPACKRQLFGERPMALSPKIRQIRSEHSYFLSPSSAHASQKKKYVAARQRLQYMKVTKIKQRYKIHKLKTSLKSKLLSSGLISAQNLDSLTKKFPKLLCAIIRNENKAVNIKSKSGIRYDEELKKFANTLHFYSPKAYGFLRGFLTLPHPSSLSNWKRSAVVGAGFCLQVIERLKDARIQDTSNIMTDVTMQVDEMAIRKGQFWDSSEHKFVGFVDKGTEDENESLATNALCCLVAGLSGGWKTVVGYIFTDKVDGNDMHEFVSHGMNLLGENGFYVHSLISDGYTANVKMFQKLGVIENSQDVSVDTINYKFSNPACEDQTVCAVYDVVHMMKLWRNFIAQCNGICWAKGRISWSYIQKLFDLQRRENIAAANKLGRNHIEFQKHKMKVSLVVQALSSSCADAIDFVRDEMKHPGFKDSEGTTLFIRLLDRTFDILNSMSPCGKGFKSPIRKENFHFTEGFLLDVCQQLLTVQFDETIKSKKGTKVVKKFAYQSNRKRPVLGFITSIKSVIFVSKKLLFRDVNPFHYVLTYRFSQDLLELFFNKIRGRLGRNNNPNVIEFRNIMKSVWHQNLLKSSNTGNCVSQMEDGEIPGGLLPLKAKPKKPTCEAEVMSYDPIDLCSSDISPFYSNCLAYIAGRTSLALSTKISCELCSALLIDSSSDRLNDRVRMLIKSKDRGGLVYPSQSVYKIVELTDWVLRSVLKTVGPGRVPTMKFVDQRIILQVLELCVGLSLFPEMQDHASFFDVSLKETHYYSLIKSISKYYLSVRFHDMTRRSKFSEGVSIRHSSNKNVLWSHV